jgi:hypothetical protein
MLQQRHPQCGRDRRARRAVTAKRLGLSMHVLDTCLISVAVWFHDRGGMFSIDLLADSWPVLLPWVWSASA